MCVCVCVCAFHVFASMILCIILTDIPHLLGVISIYITVTQLFHTGQNTHQHPLTSGFLSCDADGDLSVPALIGCDGNTGNTRGGRANLQPFFQHNKDVLSDGSRRY